jgi:zinc finger HIT domain-containing protein 1
MSAAAAASSGAGSSASTGRRQSTRTSVISKAMRFVDEDTRQEVRNKRIQQLEADNYGDELLVQVDEDDAYEESEVSSCHALIQLS